MQETAGTAIGGAEGDGETDGDETSDGEGDGVGLGVGRAVDAEADAEAAGDGVGLGLDAVEVEEQAASSTIASTAAGFMHAVNAISARRLREFELGARIISGP